MKPSLRAALLNALVFPGAGHIYLKRAARGCLFLLPTLAAAAYFFSKVIERAGELADQIGAGTLPLDPALIAAKLESAPGNSTLMTVSVYIIVACWVASIVDVCLFAGKQP